MENEWELLKFAAKTILLAVTFAGAGTVTVLIVIDFWKTLKKRGLRK